jgi:hypothetical protein
VWSHLWGVVPIGSTQKAEEVTGYKTEKGAVVDGLFIAGEFFVGEHQTAKEVYTAMTAKGGDGLPSCATGVRLRRDEGASARRPGLRARHEGPHSRPDRGRPVRGRPDARRHEPETRRPSREERAQRRARSRLLAELKAGARNSSEDTKMLQQIHDLTTELGIDCSAKGRAAVARRLGAALFKALRRRATTTSTATRSTC